MEKWKKMVKINLSILVFCPTIYLAILKVFKKFEDSGSHRSREICNRKFDWRERKMNKQRKWYAPGGWFSLTQCNKSYPTFVPNFKILGAVVPEKSLTQISLCITMEWEMEKSKTRKRKQKLISASWFSFPQYTWPLSRCTQNLKTLALIEAEKSVTEIFIGEKEKWTNNGNDKQEEADSLLHNTTSYTQHLYQISKS